MWSFRRHDPTQDIPLVVTFDDEGMKTGRHVRCPRCQWVPSQRDMWICTSQGAPEYFEPGCGTAWHTFDTKGRCPGCSHQWRWTSCLSCHQWSPHEEWYEEEGE